MNDKEPQAGAVRAVPDSTTPLAKSKADRVPELDGIRGLAILLILVWHYFYLRFTPDPASVQADFWPLLALSWSGVDLFFVLSGFLIAGILLDHRDSSRYFPTFYLRRFCRIVPLYFLLLIGFGLAMSANLQQRSEPWKWLLANPMPLWSYPVFLQNFFMFDRGDFGASALAVTWSLAIEEQFYLIFPWLVRYVPRSRLPYVLLALVALAPVFRILFYSFHRIPPAGGFFLVPGRFDALGLGAIAALAIRSQTILSVLRKHHRLFLAILALFFVGFVIISFTIPGIISAPITYWGRSWLALFFVLLILSPFSNSNLLSAIFRVAPLRKLGTISYGVYLLHLPAIGLLDALVFHGKWKSDLGLHLVMVGMAVATTLFLSANLYRFFEKPIIEFGHRFKY